MNTTPVDDDDTTAPATGLRAVGTVDGQHTTLALDRQPARDNLTTGPTLIQLEPGGESCLPGQLCD